MILERVILVGWWMWRGFKRKWEKGIVNNCYGILFREFCYKVERRDGVDVWGVGGGGGDDDKVKFL